ncbi:MAG: hypothetical protein ABI706_20105 [Ilumatobacteraceae bacterium]
MPGPFHEDEPNLKQTLPGDMHTVTGSGFDAPGVEGTSTRNNGVHGSSASEGASGVYGDNTGGGYGVAGRSMQGIGVLGEGGTLAGRFIGNVEVTGDIRLANADCAEDFDIAAGGSVVPGTVMVFDDDGSLRPSERQYDTRVAGVVSGAGTFRPGIVLDRRSSSGLRLPIALLGKVYCMVDADHGAVQVGDLLTSSPTAGHAMKVTDPAQAFGAVIGKALQRFEHGQGLIPILVTLQ